MLMVCCTTETIVMSRWKKSKREDFVKAQSVCVVVYDMSGAPISDTVANEIADAVLPIVKREKYAISLTRS
jgi:hypothetical protein